MKRLAYVIFILLISIPALAKEEEKYLCYKNERVIFGCNINQKMLSLCAAIPLHKIPDSIQYRFGTHKKIEMEYPNNLEGSKNLFKHSHTGYSGGGEGRIRFKNKDYEYIIFDRMYRTNFKAGEPNNPAFDSGVVIRRKGKTISQLHCNEKDTSIQTGYDFIKEDFDRGLVY